MRACRLPVLLLSLALASCANHPRPKSPSPAASQVPGDSPTAEHGAASAPFLILTAKTEAEILASVAPDSLSHALQERHCGDRPSCDAVRRLLHDSERFRARIHPTTEVPLPRGDLAELASRSLEAEDRARLPQFPRLVYIETRGPAFPHQVPARAAYAVASALAESLDGLVLDPIAVRYEAPRQFNLRTIRAPWGQPALSIRQVTIHEVRSIGAAVSMDTAGLSRFGLPELEVPEVSPSAADPVGSLLNALAYKLAFSGPVQSVSVSLRDIAVANDLPLPPDDVSATAVTLGLQAIERESGDDREVVLRVVPPSGANAQGYGQVLAQLLGSEDRVTSVDHDAELMAASARARAALPAVLARFRTTMESGAELLVKLPFDVPGQQGRHEWMWIEVVAWDDSTISGFLANKPELIPGLQSGARVSGALADVFDYLLRSPDGRTEGGTTNEIMLRREREVRKGP